MNNQHIDASTKTKHHLHINTSAHQHIKNIQQEPTEINENQQRSTRTNLTNEIKTTSPHQQKRTTSTHQHINNNHQNFIDNQWKSTKI